MVSSLDIPYFHVLDNSADLGGIMGLMVGASIFSIIEIGGFILGFIFITIKHFVMKLF